MKKCDGSLQIQNDALDNFLSRINSNNRAICSQTVLLVLRHFVEHVMLKIYCEDCDLDLDDDWPSITAAKDYIYSHNQYSFLSNFHREHLQKTVSHKVESLEYAETLMILYYKPLVVIKDFLLRTYNFRTLSNIDKYPLDLDNTFLNYYRSIQKVVFKSHALEQPESGYYYVYKKKPIWIDNKLMYELTLGLANDYADKQDRFIAFSSFDIFDNYAIEAYIVEDRIDYFNSSVGIKIIVDYHVSIRTYELNNIGVILCCDEKVRKKQKEFQFMMEFIKRNFISLDKIVKSSDEYFIKFSKQVQDIVGEETPILKILEKSREIIVNNNRGSNVLKYLLCNSRNTTITSQTSDIVNPDISNLKLRNGVLPFEDTPYAANLIRSKQSLSSVYKCIDSDNIECQLLANMVGRQSDNTGQLYVHKDDICGEKDISSLIKDYNNIIPSFQTGRRLQLYNSYVYIKENETNTVEIIKELLANSTNGVTGYYNQAARWIAANDGNIKGEEKRQILLNMFDKSRVFVLYGSAGTGKSTTVSFVLNILGNIRKLCLAPTHPAIDNMQRKINDQTANYYTIKKFLSDDNISGDWDIVVIDECSVVSNRDMINLLNKLSFGVLLLTGDIFQLPSIDFGNWFHVAKAILPNYAVSELTEQFRTNDSCLLELWKKVRLFDDNVYEYLSNNGMTKILDETIFDDNVEDQIILCYNYDGLYGINSINRYLQSKNPNKPYYWNQYVFKVGDPVIFHNTKRYGGILHNNLKGKIVVIDKLEDRITFDIAIDVSLSEMNLRFSQLQYIKSLENGWTIVRFSVYKYNDEEEDEEPKEMHTIPFQIAYAVSIHKSQGLEYDSVKVIIANNVDELITHNVFYTAITRAKKKLMIYWTPETASKVLSNFKPHFDSKDSHIVKNRFF